MVRSVTRLLRLWGIHAYLDFIWMTRDLKYFLICYISEVFIVAASATGMLLLAERFDGIGQWSKFQFIFMLGYAALVSGLMEMLFGYNILYISRRLGRGQMDHTLLQPQPVWMTLLSEGFTPFQSTSSVLPGIVLMIWSYNRLSIHMNFGLFLLNLAGSCAVIVAFSFLWGTLAFRAPRSAEEISSSALHMMNTLKIFPLDGLASHATTCLLTAAPVGFIAWYPCRSLLGLDKSLLSTFLTPAAGVAFSMLAGFAFYKGMKHYEKTGSQRYSGWGHRS